MNIPTKPTTRDVEIDGNFVDGREIEAGTGEMLDVRNPATGEVIARIPNSTADDVDRAMKGARAAFDGREIEAGTGEMLDVRNPATGEVIAKIPNSTEGDVDRAMKSARAAFEGRAWGGMDIRSRARLVNRLADAFEANLE